MEIRVNFLYKERMIPILCKSDEKMTTVLGKLISKLNPEASINDYEYYYNKEEIGLESTLSKNIKIKDSSTKEVTISVKRRIRFCKCPGCKCNDCIINLSNYLCAFYGCKYCKEKAHELIIIYDNYKANQTINYSEIRCQEPACEKNLENDEYDFYKCLDCSKSTKISKYYCTQCILKHKKNHTLIKYDEKHYYCDNHFEQFEKSCLTCKKDLCKLCEEEHSGHEIANYTEMTTDIEGLKDSLDKIKDRIESLDEAIKNITYQLNGTKRIYERYYDISLDILKKYQLFNKKLKNYRILRTVRNLKLSNKQIIADLDKIITNGDLKDQSSTILEIYQNKLKHYEGTGTLSINNVEKESNDDWYKEIQKNKKEKLKVKQKGKPTKNNP